eukprot:1399402-Pyramimonas_sp.AAC.1
MATNQESKGIGGKLALDEQQAAFSGVTRAHAAILICPDLAGHVRSELERRARSAKPGANVGKP